MTRKAGIIAIILLSEVFTFLICRQIFLGLLHHPGFALPSDLNTFRWEGGQLGRHPVASTGAIGLWLYPPPFLLLAAPLSWLPPILCYLLWTLAGILAMAIAGRVIGAAWPVILLGLLAPASIYCLVIGQVSEIASALLLISLALAPAAPILAGVFAGVLVLKPQFAILVPVCFLASRNWRAILSAGVTAMLLCLISALLFGLRPWAVFFTQQPHLAAQFINRPWPQNDEYIMVSSFTLMRSLGAALHPAYAAQSLSTMAAVAATWRLWRSPRDPALRLAVTLCLLPLASPYVYLYDLPALAMALVFFCADRGGRNLAGLAMFWAVTGAYMAISMRICSLGAAMLLLLTLSMFTDKVARQNKELECYW